MFLASSFYAYLIPLTTPLLIVFFFLQYWLDKYNMFHRSSLPNHLNFTLNRYTLKIFESSIFLYSLGGLLFSYFEREQEVSILQLFAFGISLLYVIFLVLATTKF